MSLTPADNLGRPAHYDAHYSQFSSQLYAEIRAEAFGEDIGQNSWLTADEHDLFIRWLELTGKSRLLEIACGAGATTLRRLLQQAGFDVIEVVDRTENMAAMAEHRYAARDARAPDLRRIEGDGTFESTQQFFRVAAAIAAKRRLSRIAFRAIRR